MDLQRLSIRQTFANIGINTTKEKLSIESPSGTLDAVSVPAEMDIRSTKSDLLVDSSKAWMALGKGNHFEWLDLISSQMHQQLMENVSRIVEEGNQLAQFTKSSIADVAKQSSVEKNSINYTGEASFDNVSVQFTPSEMNVDWKPYEIKVNYYPQKPLISFDPAKVNIYLERKNSIQMWISNYDWYV